MNVLVIEDEPVIAMVLEELLLDEGYQAVTRPDGPSGLEYLTRQPPPDVVLVDLFMPGMTGREVVEAMRTTPRLRDTPVVLITGAVPTTSAFPPKDAYQALIRKPFDVDDVLETLQQVMADKEKRFGKA